MERLDLVWLDWMICNFNSPFLVDYLIYSSAAVMLPDATLFKDGKDN